MKLPFEFLVGKEAKEFEEKLKNVIPVSKEEFERAKKVYIEIERKLNGKR